MTVRLACLGWWVGGFESLAERLDCLGWWVRGFDSLTVRLACLGCWVLSFDSVAVKPACLGLGAWGFDPLTVRHARRGWCVWGFDPLTVRLACRGWWVWGFDPLTARLTVSFKVVHYVLCSEIQVYNWIQWKVHKCQLILLSLSPFGLAYFQINHIFKEQITIAQCDSQKTMTLGGPTMFIENPFFSIIAS